MPSPARQHCPGYGRQQSCGWPPLHTCALAAVRQSTSNDPTTVLVALEGAFEDNMSPSTPIYRQEDRVTIVVTLDPPDRLPAKFPSRTAADNSSLRAWGRRERGEFYSLVMASNVLATAKETFEFPRVPCSPHRLGLMSIGSARRLRAAARCGDRLSSSRSLWP